MGANNRGIVDKSSVSLPVNVNTIISVWPIDINLETDPLIFGTDNYTGNSFGISGRRATMIDRLWFRWFAICI